MGDKVTYEEQEEMGLIRHQRSAFVAPLQGEVLPPVRKVVSIPVVVDPYADHVSKPQMLAENTVDPIIRYKAMVSKVDRITIALAVLTGALLLALQWYQSSWGLWALFAWVVFASLEWLGAYAFTAILDYKETPSAQNWYKMKSLVEFMSKEQDHRLREMYPDQYDENGRRKWR